MIKKGPASDVREADHQSKEANYFCCDVVKFIGHHYTYTEISMYLPNKGILSQNLGYLGWAQRSEIVRCSYKG